MHRYGPGGTPCVVDTWYVRDPQGNELAVYERYTENDTLYTWLREFPIYGADRLGLVKADKLLSKVCISCQASPLRYMPGWNDKPLVIAEDLH